MAKELISESNLQLLRIAKSLALYAQRTMELVKTASVYDMGSLQTLYIALKDSPPDYSLFLELGAQDAKWDSRRIKQIEYTRNVKRRKRALEQGKTEPAWSLEPGSVAYGSQEAIAYAAMFGERHPGLPLLASTQAEPHSTQADSDHTQADSDPTKLGSPDYQSDLSPEDLF